MGLGIARPTGDPSAQQEAFLDAHPQLREKRMVLFLGRIHPKKGCDLLIEAFARVAHRDPLLQLVIAGPDERGWQADLSHLAAQRDVSPRVTFTGPLYGDRKWSALRSAEVLALPSHAENFGISLVEALACGVPALISNEVNIWREIDSDGAGLVGSADVAGTLGLLDRWLNFPLAAQHQMRENALRSFAKRFELEHFAREFAACLGAR